MQNCQHLPGHIISSLARSIYVTSSRSTHWARIVMLLFVDSISTSEAVRSKSGGRLKSVLAPGNRSWRVCQRHYMFAELLHPSTHPWHLCYLPVLIIFSPLELSSQCFPTAPPVRSQSLSETPFLFAIWQQVSDAFDAKSTKFVHHG
jgi:hypothetical protein